MTQDDPGTRVPPTSTNDGDPTELTPAEEPVFTGTVFLTFVLLVVIGGVWVVMYRLLLNR